MNRTWYYLSFWGWILGVFSLPSGENQMSFPWTDYLFVLKVVIQASWQYILWGYILRQSMKFVFNCWCRFMQKNQSTFFLSAYDGSKGVEGKGKDWAFTRSASRLPFMRVSAVVQSIHDHLGMAVFQLKTNWGRWMPLLLL